MGEPAAPTKDELVNAHHLAEAIVQGVEQDEKTPIETLGGRALASNICTPAKEAEIDHRLLVLAQLVLRQDREIELLRRVVGVAMDVADCEANGPDHQSNLACEEQTNCDHCNAEMAMYAVLADVRAEIEELRRG